MSDNNSLARVWLAYVLLCGRIMSELFISSVSVIVQDRPKKLMNSTTDK